MMHILELISIFRATESKGDGAYVNYNPTYFGMHFLILYNLQSFRDSMRW